MSQELFHNTEDTAQFLALIKIIFYIKETEIKLETRKKDIM